MNTNPAAARSEHAVQFLFERVQKLFLRHFANDLSVLNEKAFTVSAGYADICFSCFTRAVYSAAHDRDLDIKGISLNHRLYLIGEADQIDLCPAACRT